MWRSLRRSETDEPGAKVPRFTAARPLSVQVCQGRWILRTDGIGLPGAQLHFDMVQGIHQAVDAAAVPSLVRGRQLALQAVEAIHQLLLAHRGLPDVQGLPAVLPTCA